VAIALLNASGCSTETIPGKECVGGVVNDDGVCESKCESDSCLDGNVCVGNSCRLQCTSHAECWPGTQDCTVATEDDSEHTVQVCLENGRLPTLTNGFPFGDYGQGCVFGGDVDCSGQFACPNGLQCAPTPTCDCQLDEKACEGKELCNVGRCVDTGDFCVFNTCDVSECTVFTCQSTGADGDANAYCTHHDCVDDSGCPAGFHCAITRQPNDICGATCDGGSCSDDGSSCDSDGDCQVGNSNFCGVTIDACIDPATFGAGNTYFEGSACLLRNTCLKREHCTPCEHNLDCSYASGLVCADRGGTKVCAEFGELPSDCASDEVIEAYVGASGAGATCANAPTIDCVDPVTDCPAEGDSCVPRQICLPKSGTCDASNAAEGERFCYHCVDDEDCGGAGSDWTCSSLGGSSDQTACYNNFNTSCLTDADCPVSPGGRNGECLDEGNGVDPASSVYHTCYFPFDDVEQEFTCN